MDFEKEFEQFMSGGDSAKQAEQANDQPETPPASEPVDNEANRKAGEELAVELNGKANEAKAKPISKELDSRFSITEKGNKTVYAYSNDPDKVAFTEKDDRLIANDNNPALIKSMLEVAESKGWETVTVKGEKEFKREAWLEAKARGLDVNGYTPTAQDERKLARLLERQNAIEEEKQTPAQKAMSLVAEADELRKSGQDDKADSLESDASLIAETLEADENPFPEKDHPMLHRQFEKGKEGREIQASSDKDSSDGVEVNLTGDDNAPGGSESDKGDQGQAMPPISEEGREQRENELRTAFQTLSKEDAIEKYPELENVYKVEPAAVAFYRAKGGLKEQEEDFKTKATDRAIEEVAAGRDIPEFDVSSYKAPQKQEAAPQPKPEPEIDFD